MTTWFNSDLHLEHVLLAHLRGFADPAEHDEALAAQWCSQVSKRDKVWVLGDVHVGKMASALSKVAALPGEKHLVAGNHNMVFPAHRGAELRQRHYLGVFASVNLAARVKLDGRNALMHHMPYAGEGTRDMPDRFTQYRLRDEGLPLLHGHTHVPQRFSASPDGTPQMHVGWDAWGGLVPAEAVHDWLAQVAA